MYKGGSKIIKDEILVLEVLENCVDIDLSRVEFRINKQNTTKSKYISCFYCLSFIPNINAACKNTGPEVVLQFVLNSSDYFTVSPRYSLPWNPIVMNTSCDSNYEDVNFD